MESLVRQHPAVILLDLDPTDIDEVEYMCELEKLIRSSAVLVLCDLGHQELARKALALGAAGIVLKMQPPSVLIAVIQSLCGHDRHGSEMRSPGKEVVAAAGSEAADNISHAQDRIDTLTGREAGDYHSDRGRVKKQRSGEQTSHQPYNCPSPLD